ncbi:hypothetical protein [Massilia yuzhufengensis]|uniref:Uncharacterized protein n=1 Tax=Massilia yuzhufengensis TaxID=1164594 RepID=A0A1I1ILP4_9BURK|nr:hypothetical protein [Massilia yuzhufengensis]SFC35168.1 hypothetical protein SAMN05216204_105198 [Massilia yuzhufengensis]
MPIPNELLATITERLSPGGTPGTAADAVRAWNRVFAKFSPLLGPLSTQLLFVRTLSEHAGSFSWLSHCATPDKSGDAFGAFTLCLDTRAPEEIVAANQVLLATYIAELSALIGDRLVIQFLRAAFMPGADIKKP